MKRQIQYIMPLSRFMGSDNFQKGDNRSEQIASINLRGQIRKERYDNSETSEEICSLILKELELKQHILRAAMQGKKSLELTFNRLRYMHIYFGTMAYPGDVHAQQMEREHIFGHALIRLVEILKEQDFVIYYRKGIQGNPSANRLEFIHISWTDLS